MPKARTPSPPKPAPKVEKPAPFLDQIDAFGFLYAGLGLNAIVLVGLIFAAFDRPDPYIIGSALRLLGFFSVAIWGGIALVAIPTLIAKAEWEFRKRRKPRPVADHATTWDGWIDGPR